VRNNTTKLTFLAKSWSLVLIGENEKKHRLLRC